MKKIFIFFAAILLIYPQEAHAYLDPNTGSMIFQALAAFFIGSLCFYKTIKLKIQSFFNKNKEEEK